MVEKEVWADLNDDGVVELTGETDWFEDPTYVNDHRVDEVYINGSDEKDYFLIGHEVEGLNHNIESQVINTDTVQVTHQRLNGDGTTDWSDRVVITMRGIENP